MPARWKTPAKYTLLQVPGWLLVGALAWGARGWLDLPEWAPWAVVAAWMLKDAALYPYVRIAYEEEGGSGGARSLLGSRGAAAEDLDPAGWVRIGSELWRAELSAGSAPIYRGDAVQVREVRGLTLEVEAVPVEANGPGEPGR